MAAALSTENLTKKFKNHIAVDNLTLEILPGEVFGLLGPDGAGKTTTIRMLSTAMEQTSGQACVLGLDVKKQAEKIREKIGYMPQTFSLYGDLSVDENIDFFADIYQVPRGLREQKKKEILEFTRLAEFRGRLGAKLSGGMQKKLALACSLVHTPELLFLDEPTTGVDPISRREFWHILRALQNITMVVATPYMDEAERCSRVGLIREGKLLVCGSPAEIKQRFSAQSLEEAFIKLIENHG